MSYKIVRLSSLLSSYGEDEVLARLSSFEPACESSNDSFLTDNAIPMEKRASAGPTSPTTRTPRQSWASSP